MTAQRSSAGRLRSKTSDISDLIRGTSRTDPRQSEVPAAPPVSTLPPSDTDGASKPKHRLSFFGRRRKSSSVSPSSAKSADARTRSDEEAPPPVPKLEMGRLSTSKTPASTTAASPISSTPLISSLPPVNVSPSSIGSLSRVPPDSPRRPTATHSAIPTLRHLRPQKSTSFEFSRRSRDDSPRPLPRQSGERPTITVSPPPQSAEEHDPRVYTTPRSAPLPPAQHAAPSRAQPDTPRAQGQGLTRLRGAPPPPEQHTELSTDDVASSRTSISSTSSTRETLSALARSGRSRFQRHASALPLSLSKPRKDSEVGRDQDKPRDTDEDRGKADKRRETHASANTTPHVNSSPPSSLRSRIPASPSSSQSSLSLRKAPPPLLTNFRRGARTQPPTEPLPSPPLSAPLRTATEDAAHMAALPTIPSLASRMSVGEVHQLVFRRRTDTLSSRTSTSTGRADGVCMADESPVTPTRAEVLREQAGNGAAAAEPGDAATVEQLREALSAAHAKYQRLSSYLLTLSERHAVEKNELMRRVEVLERDARKREREITGLRWLVMHAGQRGGAAGPGANGESPRPAAVTRLRSGSKSSAGSPRTGGGPGSPGDGVQRGFSMDSTVDSMEEGLFEMQNSVSDLIAPLAPSPPQSDAIASPVPVPVPRMSPALRASMTLGHGQGAVQPRMRRAHTLPDGLTQFPTVSQKQKQKQAWRTSSPVLPTGLGIGVDIPSIPSLADSDVGHITPASSSSGSAMSSIPPLTAANTASSGLSAIPESPRSARQSSDTQRTERAQQEYGDKKEEERTSHASESMSTSSTFGSSAYTSKLPLAMSPSIGQVLDTATEKDSGMEVVLRKLRAFAPS
ncbi:predicted protein [Postia placenta Mad-698-R]|uniref:Uncharacterized protein n=1 Tax=Postia placenta MAD-698-R-SB12 TaxID=670580 RepID=A0A1X6MQ24_9APHY|nr:hypothetical protein POSPLADRAFT_1036444 [Postia placenta MAD-698-R-SB12]EED81526.1 predicted protein [Postia placenta Mad-698-R]OSX58389.1 hypothetical protein POSPLADRAFT_1036444 [Postia placenta MAD-698-R-SB12]